MAETANGCLVLHIARTIAERRNREPKNLKRLLCALLLERVRRTLALLTKTYHGCRQRGPLGKRYVQRPSPGGSGMWSG